MTPSEERALSALLTSKTKLEAAEKAGITDRTLRRYFENPEFCQRVREAFAAVSQDATNRARQLLAPALDTLDEVMRDTNAPPAARTNAARIAIEAGLKLTEQNDILEQLRELERWRDETDGNR